MTPVEIVLRLLAWLATFVREDPPGSNAGPFVEAIIRWGGGFKGESWCAFAVYFVGSIACGIAGVKWPLPRTGSCETLRQWCFKHGLIVASPVKGGLYLLLNDKGRAHHVGFCTTVPAGPTYTETSGNTSDPDKPPSREGWGVFPHKRVKKSDRYLYIDWSKAIT